MTSATPEIKGWCPGAYAPMASNDGLLIRAKLIGPRMTARQANEVASIAADCGNGEIDLSQRAQLQIRGVSAATLDDALRRLQGVGLLAPSADAERITNVLASPLAGLAQSAFDADAMAQNLAVALQADAALTALPAKFLFAIDDGGPLSLAGVAADIRIEAARDGGVALRIAGAPQQAVLAQPPEAVAIALKLARAFVTLRAGREFELRRMRALVGALGADALAQAAGVEITPDVTPASGDTSLDARNIYGAHALSGAHYVGVATPFGRWRAHKLAAVAEIAANEGLGEIRLTPWRAILIPTRDAETAQRTATLAWARGCIVSPEDARLSVVACPGAPECPQALGPTRNHLARVAALAQKLAGADGVGLHISGCAKGCARPGATPVTLVVKPQGFDIVDNGRAADAPALSAPDIAGVVLALAERAAEKDK